MFRRWIDRIASNRRSPQVTPPPIPAEVTARSAPSAALSDLNPLPPTAIEIEWAEVLAPPPAPRQRSVTPLNTAALEHLWRTPEQKIDVAEFIRRR